MPKKHFTAEMESGFLGEGTKYKKKVVPWVESDVVKNYMNLRDSFDWDENLPPPKYSGVYITAKEIGEEPVNYGLFGASSASTAKIVTEDEDKAAKESRTAESRLQTKLCKWLTETWPDVIFNSDFAAGMKLTPFLATLRKEQSSNHKYPDVTISEARGGYFGLYVEVKTLTGTPYLKDGSISTGKHITGQNKTLTLLKSKGYCACFGVGEDQCKRIISKYMGFEVTVPNIVMK